MVQGPAHSEKAVTSEGDNTQFLVRSSGGGRAGDFQSIVVPSLRIGLLVSSLVFGARAVVRARKPLRFRGFTSYHII